MMCMTKREDQEEKEDQEGQIHNIDRQQRSADATTCARLLIEESGFQGREDQEAAWR